MSTSLYQKALRLLSRRAHSREELRRKLGRTGSPQQVEETLDRLESVGYLNDLEYACQLALNRRLSRMWGARRIRLDLKRKGLDAKIITRALAKLENESSEQESLKKAVHSWVRRFRVPRDTSQLKRLYDHCLRLGYPSGMVRTQLEPFFKKVDWYKS